MKVIVHEGSQYVLRFDKGEEVITALKQFCQQEKISAGFFHGLGACGYLKLASYIVPTKEYKELEFTQDLEIANLVGDIAMADGELVIHMHGTFSDDDLKAFAGHVREMKVAVTCELMLTKFDKPMNRKLDPEIGLKLLE